MELLELAKKSKDIIKPFGEIEALLYYGIVAKKLKKYLAGKEIAAKNWLGKAGFMPYLIKRGSKIEPLYIEELDAVTYGFLETRKNIEKLADAKQNISKTQAKIWEYFLPRKLSDFFYATNNEKPGKPIERLFFDIDRGNLSKKDAQKVAKKLVEVIQADKSFLSLFKGEIGVLWTGSSFHVSVFLNKNITSNDYNKHIAYKKDAPLDSFTGRFAKKINDELKIKVIAGHEKQPNAINIDPSQTPSGKLCRAPFSLHMKDNKNIDGVALPVSIDELKEKNLIEKLESYTPKKVVDELNELSKKLPKKFR